MSEDKAETSGLHGQLAELSNFLAMTEEMLCVAGLDGFFKRINPAWKKILGYNQEHLLAIPFLELVHPDDRKRTLAAVASLA